MKVLASVVGAVKQKSLHLMKKMFFGAVFSLGFFCGGVAPLILLSAPPTEVQILILHHQALLYLITMKPHNIITQPTNHIVKQSSKLNFEDMFHYLFKSVGGTTKYENPGRTLLWSKGVIGSLTPT